jgi:hypothetical protein
MWRFHKIKTLPNKDTGHGRSDVFSSILRLVLARPATVSQGVKREASAERFFADCRPALSRDWKI